MTNNQMILNGNDIGISKIEFSKEELYIKDKIGKYSICVHIHNWEEISNLEIGKRKKIDFNEYCLGENNESDLICPTDCYIKKPSQSSIIF